MKYLKTFESYNSDSITTFSVRKFKKLLDINKELKSDFDSRRRQSALSDEKLMQNMFDNVVKYNKQLLSIYNRLNEKSIYPKDLSSKI